MTPNTPEHEAAYNILMKQQQAVVVHYLKAVGVTDEAIQLGLNVPMTGFADYAARVCALLPVGFDVKPLDVFLEYQWNFGKKADGELNDKTFPTLPKNMKGGYFVVPAQPGVWVESVQEDGSLCYKNSNGAKHPFDKDANFMKGNKGTQQVSGAAAQTASPMAAQAPVGAATGKW